MPALAISNIPLSVEDYLAGEELSEVKHEYLAGTPHAMAGASMEHGLILANLTIRVGSVLWGKPCAIVGPDTKLKLRILVATFFYYPDAVILCGEPVLGRSWCENPSVIFEIISDSTRSTDEREKSSNYKTIATLDAYVRIEQNKQLVVVERRMPDGWVQEKLEGPTAVLSLPTVGVEIPISDLYQRLNV